MSAMTPRTGEQHRPAASATSCNWVNTSTTERIASAAAGAALAAWGLRRGDLLGYALAACGGGLLFRGASGHCVTYQLLGISTARRNEPGVRAQLGCRLEKTLVIGRPADELYAFWRELENLPRILPHLRSVETTSELQSHWVAEAPLNQTIEWDAEIINERQGELIAWQSLPGGQVDTAGSVHFEPLPGGRETRLHVSLKYDPPGGKASIGIARLLGEDLEQRLDDDLQRFRVAAESGELKIASSEALARRPR